MCSFFNFRPASTIRPKASKSAPYPCLLNSLCKPVHKLLADTNDNRKTRTAGANPSLLSSGQTSGSDSHDHLKDLHQTLLQQQQQSKATAVTPSPPPPPQAEQQMNAKFMAVPVDHPDAEQRIRYRARLAASIEQA